MAFIETRRTLTLTFPASLSGEEINTEYILRNITNNFQEFQVVSCLHYSFQGRARISFTGKSLNQVLELTLLEYSFLNKETLIGVVEDITTKYVLVNLGGFYGFLLKNHISAEQVYFNLNQQQVLIKDHVFLQVGQRIKTMAVGQIKDEKNFLFPIARVALSLKRRDLGVIHEEQ